MAGPSRRTVSETPPALVDSAAEDARRFFRHAPRGAARSWRAAGGGREVLAAGSYAQRRDFMYWEIEYIVGGRGQAEVAGRREALAAGAVYATGPETRRGRRSDPRRPLRRYYLWLEGPGAEAALRAAGLADGRVRMVESPGEAREAFEWILREGARPGEAAEAALGHLVRVLLLKLAAARGPVPVAGPGGVDTDASARASFERCRALVDSEAARLKGTAEIAAAAGLRRETICRLFQRFLNITPGAYLRARRARLAAERLREPGARVKEVAASLGFADAFHFSRVFRAEMGVSPRAWRAGTGGASPTGRAVSGNR